MESAGIGVLDIEEEPEPKSPTAKGEPEGDGWQKVESKKKKSPVRKQRTSMCAIVTNLISPQKQSESPSSESHESKGSTTNSFEPLTDPEDKAEDETGEEEQFVALTEHQAAVARLDNLQDMINSFSAEANIIQGLQDVALNDNVEVKSEETQNLHDEKDFHQAGSEY